MSAQATVWVWDHSLATDRARLLMLALADSVGFDERIEVGVDELLQMTRMSVSELRADLRLLTKGISEITIVNNAELRNDQPLVLLFLAFGGPDW